VAYGRLLVVEVERFGSTEGETNGSYA